jgi:glutaredoxin
VTLYKRADCHLCAEAKREILAAKCEGQYFLQEIDIDTDPALARRYGWDVPVVAINGIDTFKHRFTAAEFRQELRRLARAST